MATSKEIYGQHCIKCVSRVIAAFKHLSHIFNETSRMRKVVQLLWRRLQGVLENEASIWMSPKEDTTMRSGQNQSQACSEKAQGRWKFISGKMNFWRMAWCQEGHLSKKNFKDRYSAGSNGVWLQMTGEKLFSLKKFSSYCSRLLEKYKKWRRNHMNPVLCQQWSILRTCGYVECISSRGRVHSMLPKNTSNNRSNFTIQWTLERKRVRMLECTIYKQKTLTSPTIKESS